MRVRKHHPGASSQGHEWTKPGQILDIPTDEAHELVTIDPTEFEIVTGKEPVAEPDPDADDSGESKKPAARGRRTRVTED